MNNCLSFAHRCDERSMPKLSPADHLQRYVHVKVRGHDASYTAALTALLAGLEQHKDHQPEVAVYYKVGVAAAS